MPSKDTAAVSCSSAVAAAVSSSAYANIPADITTMLIIRIMLRNFFILIPSSPFFVDFIALPQRRYFGKTTQVVSGFADHASHSITFIENFPLSLALSV